MNKIEIIYKMIINGISLNDANLKIHGFSENEIEELLAKKVIIRMGNGAYQLSQVEELRKYGVKLKQEGQKEEADKCFEICYELCPKGRNICLQAMLSALEKTGNKKPDYEKAFEIYGNLEEIYPEKNQTENRLYLYLLSVIAYPPEKCRKKSSKIIPKTLIPEDQNSEMFEIIKEIVKNKFPHACKLIKAEKENQTDPTILLKLEVLGFLCDKAAFTSKMSKGNILNYIKQGNYKKVKDILETTKKKRKLNVQETNILLLVTVIIQIEETAEIPVVTNKEPNNLWEAIHGYNFSLAEQINNAFKNKNEKENSDDAISLLLTKIKGLIKGIEGIKEIETKSTDLPTSESASELIVELPTSTIAPTSLTTSSIIPPELIQRVEELAEHVLSSGFPVHETIRNYGIMIEDSLLVKLSIARRYFEAEEYETGDKYLEEVENSNLKTPVVEAFLKEIKENRTKCAETKKTYARRLIAVLNIRKQQI